MVGTLAPDSFRSILKERGFWLLLFLGVLFFWRPLFLGETFFFRDLAEHFLPQKQLLVDTLKAGELPLWDPYRQGGRPFLGNPNNVVLYPTNLLYLFLPLLTAFNLDIVFHFLFSAAAAYLCARILNFRPVAAFVCGVIYGYCGYALSLGAFLSRLYAAPYWPLMLAAWHLFLAKGGGKRFLSCCVLGVIQLFSGAPEALIVTTVSLLMWGLAYPFPIKKSKTVLLLLCFVVLVVGLGAIQILPAREVVAGSYRGSGMGVSEFGTYSLNPKRMPEMIFPEFLGRVDTLAESDYWGREIEVSPFPHPYFGSIYFGLLALALAVLGGLRANEQDPIPLQTRRVLFACVFFSMILSLGRYLPFFSWIYSLPVINWFRYPVKFLGAGVLPIALLAASGINILFVETGNKSRILTGAWIGAGILLLLAISIRISDESASQLEIFFFHKSEPVITRGLIEAFTHASAIWLLAVLLYHRHLRRPKDVYAWMIGLVLCLDLMIAGQHTNPTFSRELFESVPNLVGIAKSVLNNGKLYRDETVSRFALRAPSNDIVWEHRYNLEVLNFYYAGFYRIPVIFHRDKDQMTSRRVLQLKTLMEKLPWDLRRPILSAAGVTLILTPEQFSSTAFQLVARVQNASSIPLYLYRNSRALPRELFVPNIIQLNSAVEILRSLADPKFDLRSSVLIGQEISAPKSGSCRSAQPLSERWSLNSVEITIRNDCDGMLVFTEPYDSGWKVSVDSRKVELMRVNYAFSGVPLSAGNHHVVRRYLPFSFLLGAAISAGFWILMIFFARKL